MKAVVFRLLTAVPTLAGVIVVTFLLTHLLPGDPSVFFTSNPAADATTIAEVRAKLGLDKPLPQQFEIYVEALAHGDFGLSITTGQPVGRDLMRRLPASAELTIVAFLLAALVAIPLGIAAALRPGSAVDHACRLIATAGVSLPTFVTGLLLIYVFYFLAGWAPEPIGRLDPFAVPPPRISGFFLIDTLLAGDLDGFLATIRQLVLPAATMALFALAPLARMTRASMLTVLRAEFIRTARANGLAWRTIVFSYAFRNALLPVITTLGMVFSYMLGANVLVEKVFAWPGIGSYALDSLLSLDYAPVQGFMLVMAGLFVLINLAVDLLYVAVDPRVGRFADA